MEWKPPLAMPKTVLVSDDSERATISRRFAVTLPESICKNLGILPGQQLEADVVEGRIVLRKLSPQSSEPGPDSSDPKPEGGR